LPEVNVPPINTFHVAEILPESEYSYDTTGLTVPEKWVPQTKKRFTKSGLGDLRNGGFVYERFVRISFKNHVETYLRKSQVLGNDIMDRLQGPVSLEGAQNVDIGDPEYVPTTDFTKLAHRLYKDISDPESHLRTGIAGTAAFAAWIQLQSANSIAGEFGIFEDFTHHIRLSLVMTGETTANVMEDFDAGEDLPIFTKMEQNFSSPGPPGAIKKEKCLILEERENDLPDGAPIKGNRIFVFPIVESPGFKSAGITKAWASFDFFNSPLGKYGEAVQNLNELEIVAVYEAMVLKIALEQGWVGYFSSSYAASQGIPDFLVTEAHAYYGNANYLGGIIGQAPAGTMTPGGVVNLWNKYNSLLEGFGDLTLEGKINKLIMVAHEHQQPLDTVEYVDGGVSEFSDAEDTQWNDAPAAGIPGYWETPEELENMLPSLSYDFSEDKITPLAAVSYLRALMMPLKKDVPSQEITYVARALGTPSIDDVNMIRYHVPEDTPLTVPFPEDGPGIKMTSMPVPDADGNMTTKLVKVYSTTYDDLPAAHQAALDAAWVAAGSKITGNHNYTYTVQSSGDPGKEVGLDTSSAYGISPENPDPTSQLRQTDQWDLLFSYALPEGVATNLVSLYAFLGLMEKRGARKSFRQSKLKFKWAIQTAASKQDLSGHSAELAQEDMSAFEVEPMSTQTQPIEVDEQALSTPDGNLYLALEKGKVTKEVVYELINDDSPD